MGFLDDFAKNKSGPQLNMLVAIALLFVSQFFLYLNDQGIGDLRGTSDYGIGTIHDIWDFAAVGTGWQLHPHIWLIMPVLLICFLYAPILRSPPFRLFGYWIGTALVFWGFLPGAPFRDAFGAQLGGVAVLLALLAAIRNMLEQRRAPRPAATAPVSVTPAAPQKPADKA